MGKRGQKNPPDIAGRYILFPAEEYHNIDLMFNGTVKELYNKTISTKKTKTNAIEIQIKNRYNENFESFKKIYDYIRNNHIFIGVQNIDDLIYEQAKFRLLFNENNLDYITLEHFGYCQSKRNAATIILQFTTPKYY